MLKGVYQRKLISEDTRKKLSVSHLGKVAWNKGKKLSEEHRAKIGLASKLRGAIPPSNLGKHHSLEHRKKIGDAHRGSKCTFWKGGVSGIKDIVRHLFEYNEWRILIYKRDKYMCQQCGQKGGKLNVDHYPKSFASIILEKNVKNIEEALGCYDLWDLNNGRTLCVSCHRKTDNYGINLQFYNIKQTKEVNKYVSKKN